MPNKNTIRTRVNEEERTTSSRWSTQGKLAGLIALFTVLLCTAADAALPEYASSRKWVEELCSTNSTPKDERIFVGRIVPQKYAGVFRYHKGITLREIIDKTPFKGSAVMVCVLHANGKNSSHAFRVTASENPDYEVKNMDMIWLLKDGPVIW